ncbi:phage tail tape measure protein [Acinetobacter corruptisaponis]|uniref:Phage tail tape measure protein n=1 Tax=Acinetobacter corruptisaponis TaxID=3045147 RepID=A0ABY8S0G5_9GAMM|nr:phage tail tape measure protein [Acinetobacter sp. KCTC 92772]WHP04771.1 phage tail tape measure protein [Acinetobacter sp. KCTC 92772]
MSNSNSTVSLTLQIKGQQAGQEMKKIADQQITATKQINQQWTQIGSAQAKFVTTAKAGTQATVQTARASDGLLKTNRMMEGVLRQQSIQTRIQSQQFKQQQATVQRLTGLMQQQQQSAQQLARWMKQVESSSKQTHQQTQQTVSLWQKGAAITAGVAAGGAIVSSALQQPRDYDRQMAGIALTAAGSNRLTPEQYNKLNLQAQQLVKDSIRQGGGKREDVSAALGEFVAGGYDLDTAKKPLLLSNQAATAANADVVDMAKTGKALKQYGIPETQMELAYDKIIMAGKAGSFEIPDMAKHLPKILTSATGAGYGGQDGLNKVLASMQISMLTASAPDDAGNNLKNLYDKLQSVDFANAVGKSVPIKKGDPIKKDGKKTVFDWNQYALDSKAKGIDQIEALALLLDRQFTDNKNWIRLKSEVSQIKGNDDLANQKRREKLMQMSQMAESSEVSKLLVDREARASALAHLTNRTQLKTIESSIGDAQGIMQNNLAYNQTKDFYKNDLVLAEKQFAQSKAYDAISESLGNAKDKVISWAQGNENLAATAYGASVAVAALGAAAGIAAIATGGKGGLGGLLGRGAGVATGAGAMAGGGALATAGQVAIAGGVGYGIGTGIRNMYMMTETGQKFDDFLGEKITQTLALFGNDNAQAALESQAKYDEMIAQQEAQNQKIEEQTQLSKDLSNKLSTLITVTQQNKPVVNINGGSLVDQISQHAAKEEKRHGVDLLSYGQK